MVLSKPLIIYFPFIGFSFDNFILRIIAQDSKQVLLQDLLILVK